MAVAAVAFTMTSCNNKANTPPVEEVAVDSVALLTEEGVQAADEVIAKIAENIEAKDAGAIQAAIETVKAKAAEFLAKNPEVAKEYLAKVQNYLKENAEAVKAAVGNNAAVSALVSTLADSPVDDVMSTISSALGTGVDKVQDAAGATKEAIEDAAAKGKEAVENAAEKGKEALNDAKEKVKEEAGKKVDEAAQKGFLHPVRHCSADFQSVNGAGGRNSSGRRRSSPGRS